MSRLFRTVAAVVLVGIVCPACLDPTPIIVKKDASTAPGDATADANVHPACRACLEAPSSPGPGCGDDFDKCGSTGTCRQIYDCALKKDCFFKASVNASISCGVPCAVQAGTTNQHDPSIGAILSLAACAHQACASVCEPRD